MHPKLSKQDKSRQNMFCLTGKGDMWRLDADWRLLLPSLSTFPLLLSGLTRPNAYSNGGLIQHNEMKEETH